MSLSRQLARLRSMPREEALWRARQVTRTGWQRLRAGIRAPRWNRADLREALADGVIDYMFRGTSSPSWLDVHAELAAHLHERHSRFVLDPADRTTLRDRVSAISPSAPEDAAVSANQRLSHRYDLLGYTGLEFTGADGDVDWHHDPVHRRTAPRRFWAHVPYLDPAIGDHKVIWELNRHQHWLQLGRAYWLTGDAKYRDGILNELESWLAANPPLVGINWASMLELGFRTMSWVWALHFLLADENLQLPTSNSQRPWLVDMFVGLHHQLTHIEQNLSTYFSPNTHLTGEALALYVAGVALPELAGSPRWAETGRRILLTEIGRQIGRDGGHAERSTHYQRYTLDFYLLALVTARRDGDVDAAAAFSRAAGRLATYTKTMADAEGRLPLIGDDDGGMLWPITGRACNDVRDSLAVAAVLLDRPEIAPWGMQEEALWIAGPKAVDTSHPVVPQPEAIHVGSRTFRDTGYVVARDRFDTHAVIDVGRHGYLNGGHAHADALALTLKLHGRSLLVDPGTFTYTMNPRLRDQLRSSMSHNTVSLNGRSIADAAGPFHWRTRADANLHASRHNDTFDWVEASHEAQAPLRHRRTIFRSPLAGWIVVDDILGTGPITASAHWHLDPAWEAAYDAPGAICATHTDGTTAWLLHEGDGVLLARGDTDSGLGWFAPVYGRLLPAWTIRATRSLDAPFTMATWIGTPQAGRRPLLGPLATSDDVTRPVARQVIAAHGRAVFLFRPERHSRDLRDCTVADYQTDARVFHYSTDADALTAFALVDASHALAARDGWISVASHDRVRDLSGIVTGATLDLHMTSPAEIRLHGNLLRRVEHIRANGRDVVRPEAGPSDTLTLIASDWGLPARVLLPPEPEATPMDVFAL